MSSRVVSSFTTRRWSQTVSQASVFPSCTPRIRSLRAFRKASKKLLLLLLRSLIITTQHKSLHLSNLPIILGAPMGSTLMQIRAGRSPYNRADALGTTSPASTQALTTPSNGIIWPETKRQVRPAWAPCSCSLFCRALTRKVTTPSSWCGSAVPNNTPSWV